jgi:hypothetical protein
MATSFSLHNVSIFPLFKSERPAKSSRPNILALNIPTKLTQSLIFLAIFMVISGLLLYRFHVMTSQYSPSAFREGLQSRQPNSSWGIIAVSFVLTVLYLPLSTLAVHGVLWSSDFWVVANPYSNSTKPQPQETLGPPEVWRDPLDFCFTTTMRRDQVNYAPVIVVMSVITLIFVRHRAGFLFTRLTTYR